MALYRRLFTTGLSLECRFLSTSPSIEASSPHRRSNSKNSGRTRSNESGRREKRPQFSEKQGSAQGRRPHYMRSSSGRSKSYENSGRRNNMSYDNSEASSIVDAVTKDIQQPVGEHFAVVAIRGRQWKVTVNDVIQADHMNLEVGTVITLDKVQLVGSLNYTLVGRPILPTSSVKVTAQVIEKSRGPYLRVYNQGKASRRTFFWAKLWHKMTFHESLTTMLRIQNIEVFAGDIQEEES